MPVLLILLLLPLVEIALFILVGNWLGLWPTLALVVLGVLGGILVLQGQRERAVRMMQGGLREVSPGTFLAQGAFRIFAGMLLIAPGFFSDAVALVLLVPAVQRMIVRAVGKGISVSTVHVRREGEIIDADYEVYEPARDAEARDRLEGPHRH